MKKIIAAFMSVMLLCMPLIGCSEDPGTPVPSTQATAEPTAPEEVFASITVTGEWRIVHDGTSDANRMANELRGTLTGVLGSSLEVKKASDTEASSVGEIILGDCRDPQQWVKNGLCSPYDFAVKVRENALVLCANDSLSYKYLMHYLKQEVFPKAKEGKLSLSSDDDMQYSTSSLQDTSYVAYLMHSGAAVDMAEIFDWRIYQNSDTKIPYRIYVPFNYKAGREYRLLVNLHGAGLRGDDNMSHLKHMDKILKMESLEGDQTIIICPQCPEDQKWVDTDWKLGSYSIDEVPESNELKAVMEIVFQLQQEFSIDADRIYACGFSMGGYGTWDLILRHSDVFAAGVPMCGAGDPSKAELLKTTPAWAVHGGMDPSVPVKGSQDMAAAMERVGADNCHYTELPTHEHDVWNYTYTNEEIFAWLFSQSK